MNSRAAALNMEKTRYANSHGLANPDNKSCPFDLAILCEHAINNPQFRSIVSTKLYQSEIKLAQEETEFKANQSIRNIPDSLKKRDSLFDPSGGLMEIEEMKDSAEIKQDYS
jgi:D-alanyl-D-alanine carboxypeptidase